MERGSVDKAQHRKEGHMRFYVETLNRGKPWVYRNYMNLVSILGLGLIEKSPSCWRRRSTYA